MTRVQKNATKLLIALLALALAFFMNSVYDKNLESASQPLEEDPLLQELSTYSYKEIHSLCEAAQAAGRIETHVVELQFDPPVPVEERKTNCPWSRGDNLAPRAGQLMARYEQLRVATLPEKAVVCSTRIEPAASAGVFAPQDFYFLVLNGVVLSSDAEFTFKFLKEEKTTVSKGQEVRTYQYDWSRILGARRPQALVDGESREYCIGRDISLSSCDLSQTQTPKFVLDERMAQWLGSKGIGPNQRYVMVVTGDKDVDTDCSHSGLKLKITYGYALPQ